MASPPPRPHKLGADVALLALLAIAAALPAAAFLRTGSAAPIGMQVREMVLLALVLSIPAFLIGANVYHREGARRARLAVWSISAILFAAILAGRVLIYAQAD